MDELLKLKLVVLGATIGAGEGRNRILMQSRTRFAWLEGGRGRGKKGAGNDHHYCSSSSWEAQHRQEYRVMEVGEGS